LKYVALRVLEILRSRSGYVSGSEIAKELGLSRSTINKIVNELRRVGYVIETHPRLGYRLLDVDDLSLAPQYPPIVEGRRISIHYLERCGSTQDVADSLAREGAPEGTIVVAEELTNARGRLSRKWFAPRGGLWLTVVLRPRFVEYLHALSLAVGVAISKALESLLGVETRLKWPNDVLLNGRKLGGVLIEARAEADRVDYVLVGIGINVNNDLPPEVERVATTLSKELGRRVPRVPLLRAVIRSLFDEYDRILRGRVSDVVRDWKERSATIGRRVRVRLVDGSVIEGSAVDVDSVGRLVVESQGVRHVVDAGDVEHVG